MATQNLRERTQTFGLRVITLTNSLPRSPVAEVIGRQLLRSGTSVGANYRSAQRARSPRDFINKMGFVEEESDESAYWIEMLIGAGLVPHQLVSDLMSEAEQLTAIAVASIRTARRRKPPE